MTHASSTYLRAVSLKQNDVSEVRTASITRATNKPRAKIRLDIS